MRHLWLITIAVNVLLIGFAIYINRDREQQSDDAQGNAFGGIVLVLICLILDAAALIASAVHHLKEIQ